MNVPARRRLRSRACFVATLVLAATAAAAGPAAAQSLTPCDLYGPAREFPRIPVCAFPGGYRDSSLIDPNKCLGRFQGPQPDSIDRRARTVTVRFRRDRLVEVRPDFGGYRIYRVTGSPDSSKMVLIRRFARQPGEERNWNFSVVVPDTTWLNDSTVASVTYPFICKGQVVHDSVVTFVDPDSNGAWEKVCRIRNPRDDIDGRCESPGDSILVLRAPPGPHNGFRTWYAITYEGKNTTLDGNYADLFVPDLANCPNPGSPLTCPNLNHKLLNIIADPVEPTAGPTPNLERVTVVPNPFRSREAWDRVGGHEIHFTNLPSDARIRIYTVAGDLVAEIRHTDRIRDFERWDLKNDSGQEVASGVYMFRVEAAQFRFQDRFVVIR